MISALSTIVDNTTLSYFYNQFNFTASENGSGGGLAGGGEGPIFPSYIRTASMIICILIMVIGVVGNVMVPLVILKSKDMRNSTNIFLINLSLADLLVLLVCTPTVLVEVNSRPETWVLGQEMCKAVPFVELTVAHASVLTILAISFERYYAICEPLKAGYVCTKARAFLICLLAWTFAAIFTSPILFIAAYEQMEYFDGTQVPVCLTQAVSVGPAFFFIMTISVFFLLPLGVLLALYAVIARHLMAEPCTTSKSHEAYHLRARKQVVMMLGTVVLSFFLCLMPFRVLTLWIVVDNNEPLSRLGLQNYYNLLYFSRIMHYLNSAVNPILYNIMSSKFREGFMRLCGLRKRGISLKSRQRWVSRNGTMNNTTLTTLSYSSTRRSNATPHSWRSESRMSIDSRTSIVQSPESLIETSPSLGAKRAVRREVTESPELRRHQSDTRFNLTSQPRLMRNQSACSPRLLRNQSGASFRKSVIIRSTLLNSRSNVGNGNRDGNGDGNGNVASAKEEEPAIDIRPDTRPSPESFV